MSKLVLSDVHEMAVLRCYTYYRGNQRLADYGKLLQTIEFVGERVSRF